MLVLVVPPTQPPNRPACRALLFALLLLLLVTPALNAVNAPLTGTPLNDGYYALYNLELRLPPTAHFQHWIADHPEDPARSRLRRRRLYIHRVRPSSASPTSSSSPTTTVPIRQRPPSTPFIKQGFKDRVAQIRPPRRRRPPAQPRTPTPSTLRPLSPACRPTGPL